MSNYRTSYHPWNAGYATPKDIRDEDWQKAVIAEGLPGGWPLRQNPVVATSVALSNYTVEETPYSYKVMGDVIPSPDFKSLLGAAVGGYFGKKRGGTKSMLIWGAVGYFVAGNVLK